MPHEHAAVVDRFCWYVRALRQDDTAAFTHLMQAMGATVDRQEGALLVRRPGLTVGIPLDAEVTGMAVQVALALFGELWPFLPWVQTAWKRLHEEERTVFRAQRAAKRTTTAHQKG